MPNSTLRSIRGVLPFFKPYKRFAIVGAVALVLGVLLLFPVPLLTMYLIDTVIPTGDFTLVLKVCGISFAVLILTGIFSFTQRYYFAQFDIRVTTDIQLELVRKLQRISPNYRHSQQSGYLLARVQEDPDRLQGLFANSLVVFAKDTLILLVGVVLLFYLNWRMAIAAMLLLPFFVLALRYFSGKVKRLSAIFYESTAQFTKKLEESIGLLDEIVSLEIEDYDLKKVRQRTENVIVAGVRSARMQGLAGGAIAIIGGIAPIVIIGFGIWEIFHNELTLGALIAFNSFIGYVFGPTSRLVNSVLGMQQASVAWDRIETILKMREVRESVSIPSTTSCSSAVQPAAVEISHATICYGEKEILRDVSITIAPGERVALVGESGSGKSTLLRAILGLTEIPTGRISVDGIEVSSDRSIGYTTMLTQEPTLFHDTIEQNIRLSNSGITDHMIHEAAKQAYIHDFILTLPEGYATVINDRGVNLSVGQKQRIAMARAILKNPRLLLLDEPSASLDNRSESILFAQLEPFMSSRTTIMTAHRLKTVQNADRIIVLKGGQIVESGSHTELLALGKEYYTLWSKQ